MYRFKPEDKRDNPRCFEWYDGLMNSNYFNAFKGVLTALDRLMEEWAQKRNSWEEVDQIFQTPTFLAIIGKMRRIWMVSFYYSTIVTSNIINTQLQEDTQFMGVLNSFIYLLLFFLSLLLYNSMVMKFQEIMVYFRETIGMVPLSLVERNVGLFNYLWKVEKGECGVV